MCCRGDIYRVRFETKPGSSIQGGLRPALVISNDKNNKCSPTVTVIKLTGQEKRLDLPVHVQVIGYELPKPSVALAEQITTIDKADLKDEYYIGHIDNQELLDKIVKAVVVQISDL